MQIDLVDVKTYRLEIVSKLQISKQNDIWNDMSTQKAYGIFSTVFHGGESKITLSLF